MSTVRRLVVVALVGALAAMFAGPAAAARPSGALYPETITTPHFVIHFTGEIVDPPNPARITFQTAGDLAANAELAYSTFVTAWAYPAPPSDGDGRIDIWVQDLSSIGALGLATGDAAGNTTTGWISIDRTAATSLPVTAHELLHLIQYGQWIPDDSWLLEGSAEWAGFAASGYVPFGGATLPSTLAEPDMSLDCTAPACGNDLYETGGYSRWSFFQYLSERYGTVFLKDVLARGAALMDPAQTGATLLDGTLATKGTTLSAAFDDYVLENLAGSYEPAPLKDLAPTTYSTTSTGVASGALPVQRVAVNHLASRFLKFNRGGIGEGPCYAAALTLTVALPAGLGAKPAFHSKSLGSGPVALSVSGNTASGTFPWDTCAAGSPGYLSLPNNNMTLDSQVFTVSGSLSVDLTKITPVGPPAPLYAGATVASPTGEVAPSIFVYGAQLVRVSAETRLVRLIVFSSGTGKLQAALGSASLGTFALRAGNNDVRFRLPVSAVKALRSTSSARAASSVLSLTSFSTEGTKGTTVTRKVAVTGKRR